MANQINPEDLPKALEKRKLDAHVEASVLDNGTVVIGSLEGGIEAILSAEQAYALLDLLYWHRDLLFGVMHSELQRQELPETPFLVQMLFWYTGGTGNSCQALPHKAFAPAVWEVRSYQNAEHVLDVVEPEVEREEMNQMVWDEAYREQETLGVRVHHTIYLCDTCACQAITNHAAEVATSLTIATAQRTCGALLLVSDPLTKNAAVVGNVPGDIQEKDILPLLKAENRLAIQFKE